MLRGNGSTRLLGVALVLAATLLPRGVGGDYDPYAVAQANDPISLARLADELGDGGLQAQLQLGLPRLRTLLAIGAAPHAEAPEKLVAVLAPIATGRDPQLAPAAAAALWTLAEGFDPSRVEQREIGVGDLDAARAALTEARGEPPPRGDVSFALDQADAALGRVELSLGITKKPAEN